MQVSSVYICPVRGLQRLEPPEPETLFKAAGAAKDLGVERLLLPVVEEALMQGTKARVRFLDGIILALDRIADARLTSWLIAPASRILGLTWAPPFLMRGHRDSKAAPVFVDGALRHLHPVDWWTDPSVIQLRIRLFRELLSAVAGHPAISGWVLLDRAFETLRPGLQSADFVLRSLVAEVLERGDAAPVHLGLGWPDLISPQTALSVTGLVDGIRMAGGERGLPGLPRPATLAEELRISAFLSALTLWLFEKPLEVQCGPGLLGGPGDRDDIGEHLLNLGKQGAASLSWWTLVNPGPAARKEIPWVLRAGLDRTGLLDAGLEPVEGAEERLKVAAAASAPDRETPGFIDIGRDEYLSDPPMHIVRLWDHFLESL
jgi:hypothetical protein